MAVSNLYAIYYLFPNEIGLDFVYHKDRTFARRWKFQSLTLFTESFAKSLLMFW